MKTIYEQVREKSLSLIKAYHTDLIEFDKRMIEENPGTPFLHFTGDTGTYLFLLIPAGEYPAKGEKVPYLFGMADRQHFLREFGNVVRCMRKVNRQDLILYFNGKRLIEINQERAESIVKKYQNRIYAEWRKEKI